MSKKPVFRDIIDEARAHALAVAVLPDTRQAHVTVQFFKAGAKVFPFDTCWGSCSTCDRIWLQLRMFLSSIEVVDVRWPKMPAPPQAK